MALTSNKNFMENINKKINMIVWNLNLLFKTNSQNEIYSIKN